MNYFGKSAKTFIVIFTALLLIIYSCTAAENDEFCHESIVTTCDGEKTLISYDDASGRCAWYNKFQYDWGYEVYYLNWCESSCVSYDYENRFESPYWVLSVTKEDYEEGSRYATYVGDHYEVEGTYELDQGCTEFCDGVYDYSSKTCYGEWVERCYGDSICGETMEVTLPTTEGEYYEVEYQANTKVYQVLLIEDSTSEVLAGFDIDGRCEGTIQDYYTGGSSDQEFWLRIEENTTGDLLKILSKFGNQPIVRVVSCDTKKKKQEGRTGLPRSWSGAESGESGGPPDEWVDGGGTLGSEITDPYNQCDLEFAGFVNLRVRDKKGNRRSMKNEVLTPLKNTGLWAEDAVQLDRFKREDDGYVAVISIQTTYCAQKVRDSVTLQYDKSSLTERSLVLIDND